MNFRFNVKTLVMLSILVGSASIAETKSSNSKCSSLCAKLNALAEDYKNETSKDKPDFDRLQIKAGDEIQKAKKSKPKMSADEVKAFVEVMRLSIPVDPGAILLERNVEVVKANRSDIENELRKLPKTESEDLLTSVRIAVDSDRIGPDSQPKK